MAREIDAPITEKVDGKDILWHREICSLNEVMEKFNGEILVKTLEGFNINEHETVKSEEILMIHGERKTKFVKSTDQFGGKHQIPIECVHKMFVRTYSDEIYKTVRNICLAKDPPLLIENTKAFTFFGHCFESGTQFKIISIYKEMDEPRGLSVISILPTKLRVTLPLATRGYFKELIMPEDREKQYMIKDFIYREFPIYVEFLPTQDATCEYGPHLGRVCLEKVVENDVISATVINGDERYYRTLPRQLDVMLRVGQVISPNIYSEILEGNLGRKAEEETDEGGTYMTMTAGKSSDAISIPNKNASTIAKNQGTKLRNPASLWGNENKNNKLKILREPVIVNMNEYGSDPSLPAMSNKRPMKDVGDALRYLQLGEYVDSFNEMQVNSTLIGHLEECDFISELKMTMFQARKLTAYLKGWRPKTGESNIHRMEAEKHKQFENWTVEDIYMRMRSIKAYIFADFCKTNQVDGYLLKRIVDENMLESLEKEHGIVLTKIEKKKLNMYMEGWRPSQNEIVP